MRCSKIWLVSVISLGLGAGLGGCKNDAAINPEPVNRGGFAGSAGSSGGVGTAGSSGGVGIAGAGGETGPLSCPAGKGPKMALLPAIDGSYYCMDVRETTRAEYDAFLEANGRDLSGQPKECAWNKSYTPELLYPDDDRYPSDLCPAEHWNGMRPNQAVSCVDFCDAYAYCEWAGKRLCGVTGAGKDIYKTEEDQDHKPTIPDRPFLDLEFVNACSQVGKTKYSYGDTYEPGRCMDQQWLEDRGPESLDVTDTASRQCNGTIEPFDEVYDLSGGVREWQNFCSQDSTPEGLGCFAKGYSLLDERKEPEPCELMGIVSPRSITRSKGIRCCADAVR